MKVKTWDLLKGPVEALALIRAVEQKYGPVESFIFQKDFNYPNLYQTYVRINFRDVESFERVPEGTETIHLRAPKFEARRPGGVGLDEIQSLMTEDPEFLTADQVSEMSSQERSIDFRVNRAATATSRRSPYPRVYPSKASLTGYEMLEWGGFYPMKPIDSTRPITNKELTEETLDHVHMRAVLRDWARYLDVRNPYEVYPEEPILDEGQEKASESSLDEKDGIIEDLPSMLDEWSASDVSKPNPERDVIKEILDMEDIDLTGTKVEGVRGPNMMTGTPQSGSAPSISPDSTSQPHEPQREQEPPLTTLSDPPPQSDSPTVTSEVSIQEQQAKQLKREIQRAREAQLLEAKKLGEMVRSRSTENPPNLKGPKTKSKKGTKKVKPMKKLGNKQPAEPKTHFGKLFHKIQSIFKAS
ncbi:hypothetical protein AGABI1DRAFT_84064 [Agaricus bisporus var. burnettii JB137-S8]|uniref:Uncharacterized protein n=2 Tax=Agaricus bisporus var. burnettii TaxID=192524 RepID=K5W2Y6_AGABU|nr:uncharacterized protein AGABI1DRAFT_84064 [Agaricus bisporus var. burnettii JB137-S8]EKM81134.1 hypothetical protein AGABI1DRAFT_84064 [Agaricus bisporus var. burnettii JB137-S8]KAF7782708.1 hypothetical protein Agabi119p4_2084 [Agaricus bisporus var. burnettii]